MGAGRIALFASGDFACNLYWQSLTLFLFFFYTDVLRLGPGVAGLLFATGSAWDGLTDLAVGAWAQRAGRYRRFMLAGAVPLGLAFFALYVVPPLSGAPLAWVVLTAHLAFRTLYALVNIPFAALSARISQDSRERSQIAAARMLFGTGASMLVALVTRSLARTAQGSMTAAHGYLIAAATFAIVGTVLLLVVAGTTPPEREAVRSERAATPLLGSARTLVRNRAFVSLNLAAAAAAIAGGVLNGSVMYYFTYVAGDAAAGPTAMTWMGLAGAAAVPGWMMVRDRLGTRSLWIGNAALALVVSGVFALIGSRGVLAAQIFLVAMHMSLIGFVFAFWAMLPDTVEWGERLTGVRVEALTFGAAALIQKLALGAGVGLLGLLYDSAGYRAGPLHDPATAAVIRATMLAVPTLAIAASAAIMAANPLRRDSHARIAAELAARRLRP